MPSRKPSQQSSPLKTDVAPRASKRLISKDGSRGTISAAFQKAKASLAGKSVDSGNISQDLDDHEMEAASVPITIAEDPIKEIKTAQNVDTSPDVLTNEEEQELRSFDLCQKFGPCVGPSRLERWERAARLGLDPPARVHEILSRQGVESPANQSMLSKYPL